MKTICFLIASILVASSLCAIKPIAGMSKHSMIQGDFYYDDLNNYFDLSQAQYPLEVTGVNAMANNQTQALISKHFQVFQFTKLNWVQQLSEDTLVFCYDNKNIIIQLMKGQGKSFGTYKKFTLNSVDVICHDVAHYEHRSQIFIGCVSRGTTSTKLGAVFVATFDYNEGKVTSIEVTDQTDGFRILNRLGLFITQKTAAGSKSPTPYLVLYDTGNTNAKTRRGSDYIRVYRNVNIGTLRYFKLLEVEDYQFEIMHAIFPYQESLIISGRLTGPSSDIISLLQCTMDFNKAQVNCDKQTRATSVTKGLVGLNFLNQYFEIDEDQRLIRVAKLVGNFQDKNWNTNLIHIFNNLEMLSNEAAYIRYYTGNEVLGTINYGFVGGRGDYGYTGISYTSGISWAELGTTAANIGNSIVYGVIDQSNEHEGDVVSIMRPEVPYILVDSTKLDVGQTTTVGVSVSDGEGTDTISTSSSFTVVKSIYDKINILSSAFGDINVFGGHDTELVLKDTDILQGNALQIRATSADNSITGQSYSGAGLQITWNPKHDNDDIMQYAFYGTKAVVQNTRGSLWFYNCKRLTDVHKRECNQYSNYPGTPSQPIRDVTVINNVLFTWTCDNNKCTAFFVQQSGEVQILNLGPGVLSAFIGIDNQAPNYLRLVIIANGTVEIFRGPQYAP